MRYPSRWLMTTLLIAAAPLGAKAQTTTWTGTSNNTFSAPGNWNNGIVNDGNAAATFSGTASGAINVDTPFSVASLTLSGANSYSFSGSTLSIGSGGITDSASNAFTFNNPIVLTADAAFSNAAGTSGLNFANTTAIDNGGHNLTLTASSTPSAIMVVSGNITGSGALTVGGTAFTILSGTGNNFSGGTTINSGATLQVGDSGSGAGSLPGNVANSGTISFKPINNPYTYTGVISGAGQLLKGFGGTNMLTLSGANTYSGSTTVSAGTLADGAAGTFSPNSGISLTGGSSSTLNVNYNESIKGLGGSGASAGSTVNLASGVTLTLTTGNNFTYNGTISGATGSLVVSGAGGTSQSLTGSSSYGGVTKISGGAQLNVASLAAIGVNSAIGTGDATSAPTNAASLVLDSGGVLAYTGATNISTDRLFTLGTGGGKIFTNGGGSLNFTNSGAIAFSTPNVSTFLVLGGSDSSTNTFNPSLGNNGSATVSLTKGNSPDTWILTGANTYTGQTSINQGTLRLGADNTLPNSAFITISAGATLDVAGNQTINNFTSGTSAASYVTLQSGKTLTVNPVTTGFTQPSYSGTISGSGSLVVTGTGNFLSGGSKLKLSGSNTYTGGTTVNSGALELNGTQSATGGFAVTVNSGGTLIGDNGSINGAMTINTGGGFANATSFTAPSATFASGTNYLWNISNATGVAGTDYGLLQLSGALAFGGTLTLKVATVFGAATNFDTTQTYAWNLATGASSLTGFNASNVTIDTSLFSNPFTGTFSIANSGNNLVVTYTGGAAIPEPAMSGLLAGLAACGLVLWRRRDRSPSRAMSVARSV